MKFSEQLKSGVILDNPVFMQTIGLCPTLATTTSLQNAIGMGAAATVVLICSNIVISAMRRIIPDKIRIAAFITIIATFVTMIDLSMQAFLPSLASSLGLFLPLIVVNCIILGRAEAYASKNKVLPYQSGQHQREQHLCKFFNGKLRCEGVSPDPGIIPQHRAQGI